MAASKTLSVEIPQADLGFFEKLAEERGWKTKTRKSGIEKALEDVKLGRLHHAKNADDLLEQILE